MWLLTRGCLLSQPPINPLPRFFRAQKWPLDEDSTLEPEGKTTAPFPCLPGGFPSVNPSLAAPSLHSHLCKEAQIAPPGASPRGCVSVCQQCLHNSPSSEQPLGTNWAAELSRGAGGAQGPEPLPVLSRVLRAAPAGDALEKAGLWGSLCAVGIPLRCGDPSAAPIPGALCQCRSLLWAYTSSHSMLGSRVVRGYAWENPHVPSAL